MFEVMNNPNKQKGGLAFTEDGWDFLLEGLSIKTVIADAAMGKLNDQVAKDPHSKLLRGVPYNRLYMYFDIDDMRAALNENGGLMPVSIKHKNGAISPEIPSGDITSMKGMRALSVIRRNDPLIDDDIVTPNKDYPAKKAGTGATIHDFKELANLREALQIIEHVDNATITWYLQHGMSEDGYRERAELSEKIGMPVQDMLARFNMADEVVRFYKERATDEERRLIEALLHSGMGENTSTSIYRAASWVLRQIESPNANSSNTGDMSEGAHAAVNQEIGTARDEGRGYILQDRGAIGWQAPQAKDKARTHDLIDMLRDIPPDHRKVTLPRALGEADI